jgi:outer membrane protein assembly factor BamB
MLRRLLLLPVVLLVACASTPSKTANETPAELKDFAATAKFAVRWHGSLGEAGSYMLRPALLADAIVGVSSKGVLSALSRSTGKPLWQVKTGLNVAGGVGAGDKMLLLGSDKGEVAAFDLSGKLLWQVKVSSEVLSAPQFADGFVLVRSADGRIAALNALNGERVWLYERATPALAVRSFASVTIQRGIVYAGFAAGKLAALDLKTGSLLWENSVSKPRGNTELDRISDITSDVAVDDEQACAIAFQGRLACFDAAQGSPLWNRDIASDKGMMLLRKFLYLSDATGNVLALEKSTGSSVWKNDQLTLRDTNTPLAFNDFVVVADFEGYLHALARDDGRLVARIKLDGSPMLGAPLELDNGLLVQTRDGGLYSLTLQ